jgi:hypothetical protein
MSQPKPGDRFSFIYLDEEGCEPRAAIVHRLLSNREEGLSPEADEYIDGWLEAFPVDLAPDPASDPAAPIQSFTIVLRIDDAIYLDGRPISVTFEGG